MNHENTTSNGTPLPRSDRSQFVSNYCGDYYNIADQSEGESDHDFQRRVAGLLRVRGALIESHEVMQGARYDDHSKGAGVVDGLIGSMAIALGGARYGANGLHFGDEAERGERIVADEYIAGSYLRHKNERPDPPIEMLLLGLDLARAGRR